MAIGRMACVVVLPVLSWALAAGPPGQSEVSARHEAAARLTRVVFAELPQSRPDQRAPIARLLDDAGHLVASTRSAAFWFGPDGEVARVLSFPRALGHPNAGRWRAGGPPVFFGSLDDVGSKVLLVPSDGTPPRKLALDGYGATLANVVGDEEREVVVRRRDWFSIYRQDGTLLRRVQASDYIWEFAVLDTNASPTEELVAYLYQDRRAGTFIELLDADGERIRAWHEPKANQYSVSGWSLPRPSLVAVLDDVVTERDVKGQVLRRLTVPGLGSYRRAATATLAGDLRLAVVSSGACPSRLLVFDQAGALVYDERFEAHAAVHVPAPGGAEFYVGVGSRIYRYHLAASGAAGG